MDKVGVITILAAANALIWSLLLGAGGGVGVGL
jgi:hypothetical protein